MMQSHKRTLAVVVQLDDPRDTNGWVAICPCHTGETHYGCSDRHDAEKIADAWNSGRDFGRYFHEPTSPMDLNRKMRIHMQAATAETPEWLARMDELIQELLPT